MRMRKLQCPSAGGAPTARRGTAAVEFAVIASFLVLLAMGTIEVTRAVQVKDMLTDAVRSGCRLAIQPGTANAAVTANINQVLTNAGIPIADVTVTVQVNGVTADASTAIKGDRISVKISLPVADVGWVTPRFFTGTSVESETLVMKRQG
jgi:Flp pilus assembly protein TadG